MTRTLVVLALATLLAPPGASPHTTRAASITLHGRVTNAADGKGVPSAHVGIGTRGTITTSDGAYSLALPDSLRGRTLNVVVRVIGYQPQHRDIRLMGDRTKLDFALQAAALALESVVVTGTSAAPVPSFRDQRLQQRAALAMAPRPRPEPRAGSGYVVVDSLRGNTEAYDRIVENPFVSPLEAPRSTFSIDVDRASYANVRRFLNGGQLPPKDAVRLEEMVNYFPYDYRAPSSSQPVSIATDVAAAPWSETHRLVRVALQSRRIDLAKLPPSNLVFLIDVSGSMMHEQKLPLVKRAFHLLVDQLREDDHVAIVVYAGNAGLVLPSTAGSDKRSIRAAIDALEAGGSTAGGAGIRLAYQVAKDNFVKAGNNRVILATDGDFNVGVSSDAELERLVEDKRRDGTFLTVLGFGMGNYKDSKLEKLADKGNGTYAYIDTPLEARKMFVHELGATLLTVAKDVKLQVEFNPARVKAYRLLGYENRMLRDQDFNDDRKDAGDMGAGHAVTAFYEIIPAGSDEPVRTSDGLRYQRPPVTTRTARADELVYVKLRYKERDDSTSRLMEHVVADRATELTGDFGFATAVAEFALLLRDSEHKGKANIDQLIGRAEQSLGSDRFGYRADFVTMARTYRALMRRVTAQER